MKKWLNFHQNHGLIPLEKSQFFDSFNFLFLQATTAFFRSRISENNFSWSRLAKKETRKMANFGAKPWTNPFGKMSIFRHLQLFVFIAQNSVFHALEYHKTHFPSLDCLKKRNMKKYTILDQNHGLTILEKSNFFNFLYLQPK